MSVVSTPAVWAVSNTEGMLCLVDFVAVLLSETESSKFLNVKCGPQTGLSYRACANLSSWWNRDPFDT